MPNTFTTELGRVFIADEVIATATGLAALDCYGLADMAPRRGVRDSLSGLWNRDYPGRGVEVRNKPDGLELDLSIIVSYGTRIPEVAENLREKVRYTLLETFGIAVDKVNISVQGVRITPADA